MRSKTNCVSFRVEKWLDDMIILKAKNKRISKSKLIRTIVMEALTKVSHKEFEKTVYYNDENGILRSRKV